MTLNTPRLKRQLRRLIARRWFDLPDAAARVWEVSPAFTQTVRPALYPEGAMARVTQLSPYRQWEQERRLIDGGPVTMGPTRGFEYHDADVVGGTLYAGALQHPMSQQAQPYWLRDIGPRVRMPEAQLVSTMSGTTFFGCLLLDDFTIELLGDPATPRLSVRGRPSSHEPDYRAMLGLGPKLVHDRVRVDRLVLFEDAPYNASKIDRYRELVRRFRANVGLPASGPRGVYLRRGLAGQRRLLVNEPEVEQALAAHGFTIIDPMALSAREIAQAMMGARCVVSVEGSQISHAIFALADEASIVVLQPPERFCLQYKEYTDAMGHHFGFTVGTARDGGFEIDTNELRHLIDRLP